MFRVQQMMVSILSTRIKPSNGRIFGFIHFSVFIESTPESIFYVLNKKGKKHEKQFKETIWTTIENFRRR